jgi:hypothetical protein
VGDLKVSYKELWTKIFINLPYLKAKLRMRLFQKTHTVILSEAKNLMFLFSSQKIKNEILRPNGLRMREKG